MIERAIESLGDKLSIAHSYGIAYAFEKNEILDYILYYVDLYL